VRDLVSLVVVICLSRDISSILFLMLLQELCQNINRVSGLVIPRNLFTQMRLRVVRSEGREANETEDEEEREMETEREKEQEAGPYTNSVFWFSSSEFCFKDSMIWF
jgi:hypothetical protein